MRDPMTDTRLLITEAGAEASTSPRRHRANPIYSSGGRIGPAGGYRSGSV